MKLSAGMPMRHSAEAIEPLTIRIDTEHQTEGL